VIGLGVVAIVALLVLFFPWNLMRGPLASYASHRLQRTVAIGHLAVDLGRRIAVRLDDVSIANAEWSDVQPMAKIRSAELSFTLGGLLHGIPDAARVSGADVLLEKNPAGEANWRFDGRDTGDEAPPIGAIAVDDGRLRYRDPELKADVTVDLHTTAAANEPSMLEFSGKGTLRGEPFAIAGRSQGFAQLRRIDDPYRLALDVRAGATSIVFDGTVVPSALDNVNGTLHLKGPDLSQLYPIVPTPLPWTPRYDLAGGLAHANGQWRFTNIKGVVGDSDLGGSFTVDVSKKRAFTTADLASRSMNYKDLGGFIGLPPGEAGRTRHAAAQRNEARKREASRHALPDKPFDLSKLRDHDVDLRFRGKRVKWQDFPIDDLATHLVLRDGIMRFDPLDFGIADGHVVTTLTVDVTKDRPTGQMQIQMRDIELKRLFPQLASPNGSAGRFSGRAHFRTAGNSIAQLFANADGDAAAVMRGGEASTLRLVLTNLDLANAAGLLMRGRDEKADVRCAVAAFHATQGVMRPDLMVIDTSEELILGEGAIDFRAEKYDLRLKADSKRPSMLALRGPVVVGGTFKKPAIHPAAGPLAARVGAAIGLGLLTPPLALLAVVDPGDAPNANCRELYQRARIRTDADEQVARSSKGSNAGLRDSPRS
jgi:uncharacterized protein involved in outer membrane biogenesis